MMLFPKLKKNKLSIITIFHNMQREAERTLYSLSTEYQTDISSDSYEVIAIDSNSTHPLDSDFVKSFGPQFHYLQINSKYPSPSAAINAGANYSNNNILVCHIDGARILSPGILRKMLDCFDIISNPFVFTLGMHLGPKVQNESILDGYNQAEEDNLLKIIDWRSHGYELFSISSLASSSKFGFFSKINESNCIALEKNTYKKLGGFDEKFISPGGGLVNLDFFNRVMEKPDTIPVFLLGEATFHQFHGGVATNVTPENHPWIKFSEEYLAIRGKEYQGLWKEPFYYGSFPKQAIHLIKS